MCQEEIMKKRFTACLTTLILSVFFSISASADVVKVDGIYYDISGTTATVTQVGDYSGDIVIPESITFENSKYSVTSIEDYAFWGCSSLTSVTIPNSVTSIGESAFEDCSSLTSVTIPNSVTSIGSDAFWGCRSLTSVTIPNSVTSIGDLAFYECSSLTSVTIPNSVTSIGNDVFSYCRSLTHPIIVNDMFVFLPTGYEGHYSIPENISTIIGGAFYECRSLTSVTIPNSVTSIGFWAFRYCENIENVYCYAEEVPSTDYYAFFDSNIENATLYVPASAIEAYETTEPWSDFGTIKAIDTTVGVESVKERGIAIQSAGGFINISGLDNNETVSFYALDGKALGTAKSIDGNVSFSAKQGTIVVARIGKESVKIAVK